MKDLQKINDLLLRYIDLKDRHDFYEKYCLHLEIQHLTTHDNHNYLEESNKYFYKALSLQGKLDNIKDQLLFLGINLYRDEETEYEE